MKARLATAAITTSPTSRIRSNPHHHGTLELDSTGALVVVRDVLVSGVLSGTATASAAAGATDVDGVMNVDVHGIGHCHPVPFPVPILV